MTVLLEETMKGYTTPHMAAIWYLKEWFSLEDQIAQIDILKDQFVETQHKSFRMNKQEWTIPSKQPLSGPLLAIES